MSGERRVRKRGEVKSEMSLGDELDLRLTAAMNTPCTDKQTPELT